MPDAPITLLLQEFAAGDKTALDRLMPIVYGELRHLADAYIRREREGHTLQPTALVHEAYLRLMAQSQPSYQDRAHFMGVAARLMRQILTDYARARKAEKRGSGVANLRFDEVMDSPLEAPDALIAVDDALRHLEQTDELKARLVELRFFGGMTAEDSAEMLHLPVDKVRNELRVAQAWLQRELDR
jgi:RNA polymerase sigma factor (TIGR02999 family)